MFNIIFPAEKILAAAWWQGFLWGAVAVLLLVTLAHILRGEK